MVQIDGTFYYTDCRRNILDKDGKPTGGYILVRIPCLILMSHLKNNDIENTYSNISKDDWSKEHSVCKGKHNLVKNREKDQQHVKQWDIQSIIVQIQGCIYR